MTQVLEQSAEYGLTLVNEMEKGIFQMGLYPNTSEDNPGNLFMLEQSLLEVGSNQGIVKGIFYLFPIYYQGKLFLR